MTFYSQPKQEGGGGKDGVDLSSVNRAAIVLKGRLLLPSAGLYTFQIYF